MLSNLQSLHRCPHVLSTAAWWGRQQFLLNVQVTRRAGRLMLAQSLSTASFRPSVQDPSAQPAILQANLAVSSDAGWLFWLHLFWDVVLVLSISLSQGSWSGKQTLPIMPRFRKKRLHRSRWWCVSRNAAVTPVSHLYSCHLKRVRTTTFRYLETKDSEEWFEMQFPWNGCGSSTGFSWDRIQPRLEAVGVRMHHDGLLATLGHPSLLGSSGEPADSVPLDRHHLPSTPHTCYAVFSLKEDVCGLLQCPYHGLKMFPSTNHGAQWDSMIKELYCLPFDPLEQGFPNFAAYQNRPGSFSNAQCPSHTPHYWSQFLEVGPRYLHCSQLPNNANMQASLRTSVVLRPASPGLVRPILAFTSDPPSQTPWGGAQQCVLPCPPDESENPCSAPQTLVQTSEDLVKT